MPESASALESEFNSIYQNSMSFYEKAMNGDRTHPFVLFKINQLRLKKSNFKKIKEIEDDMKANAIRQILIEDIKTFVREVKEYELKMRTIKEAKKKAATKKYTVSKPGNYRSKNTFHSNDNTRKPYNPNFRSNNTFKASTDRPRPSYKSAYNDTKSVTTKEEHTKTKKTSSKYMKTMNFKKKGSKR